MPRPWLGFSATFMCVAGARRLQCLLIADIGPGDAVGRLGAVSGTVDFAHPERIDPQFARQLIDALSRANVPIGAPGARYAATFGRLHTTS